MNESLHKEITWMIGGPAGYGINASGELFSRCFTRGGLNVLAYLEYPSLIRGGHNNYSIRVSPDPIHSPVKIIDLLACLNKETFDLHGEDIASDGGIIYDPAAFEVDRSTLPHQTIQLYPVPLSQLVKDHGGIDIMRNTVALGASLGLLAYPFDYLKELITKQFEHKGEKVVDLNVTVAKAGYDFVTTSFDAAHFPYHIAPLEGGTPQILLSGNSAIAYGAMKAGCKFYCAYPMTPASSILSVFARHEEEMDIVVKQPEDELAAVLHTIGASYAGVRAMTATSGGGFALMTEALSLAGIAEVPLVLVESQRPGPGTGLPTWTGQSDLQFVIHAGHDEFPKLVMAAGDVKEAFTLIQYAFNVAERFHMPVILLSEKSLSESLFSLDTFDDCTVAIDRGPVATTEELAARAEVKKDYPRYQFTESGVSKRVLPGMPNARYVANSNEHDDVGDITEDAQNRHEIHAKRMRKLETLKSELPPPVVYGAKDAEISLIGWGATKGPALEALEWLEREGIKANYMQVTYLHPFDGQAVRVFLDSAKTSLLIEGNYNAQLGQLIRQHALVNVDHDFLKWDGRPFFPSEIGAKVKSILNR